MATTLTLKCFETVAKSLLELHLGGRTLSFSDLLSAFQPPTFFPSQKIGTVMQKVFLGSSCDQAIALR